MKTANYFAMDFGASTGRGITGRFDGKKLELEEVHRFSNYFVVLNASFIVLGIVYVVEMIIFPAI